MNQFDRIYALHCELSRARHPVSRRVLEDRLECSAATIKRIIGEMRLYLDAPIEYHRERNGYYYADSGTTRFELPGLWFNDSEVVSLLIMDQLLEQTEPGLLARSLAPVRRRLETILHSRQLGAGELAARVRILRAVARPAGVHFRTVASALIARRRLLIRYHGRGRDTVTEREISPQRLTYYRDNWYLDAWCHQARGLRSFAVERIRTAVEGRGKAKSVSGKTLDAELASGYGIFAGRSKHTAVLRFSADAARWVADECWHPEQRVRWLEDGSFELRVPYSRADELLHDILGYGADVRVEAPAELRRAVSDRLQRACQLYRQQ